MNKDTNKYPRFIPDIPAGKDCFEGHSQEKLAHSVCNYIKLQDAGAVANATSKTQEKTIMPRILGIEGSWGSGKSNVVNMIERELSKDGYFTFTYDAWGHQEDLQRRSILETLAINLINNGVLQGDVEIQMRNGKKHKASWKERLLMAGLMCIPMLACILSGQLLTAKWAYILYAYIMSEYYYCRSENLYYETNSINH